MKKTVLSIRLKQIRERLALSQRELSVILGIAPITIGRYENAQSTPSRAYLYALKWLESERKNLLAACELEPEDVLNFDKPPTCRKCNR